MPETEQRVRAILEHNVGFQDPQRWIAYASAHAFKEVRAHKVVRCPDCAGTARGRPWGQYVYYSTLIRLEECAGCGLVWADAHIDPDVVRAHFEVAYKDDQYFRDVRRATFEHLVDVIDRHAPRGARVLDIGGARGDLMAQVATRRADLKVVVNDVSEVATSWAARHFGLATLTGDAGVLAAHREQYGIVVLSDVLYYEPNLRVLWDALSRLVAPGGAVVIRVPNKTVPIRLGQLYYRLIRSRARRLMQDRIPFFNPEHIFIFRQQYLHRRLAKMGFQQVRALPSPPAVGSLGAGVTSAFFRVSQAVNWLSRYQIVVTPSMLVVASNYTPA